LLSVVTLATTFEMIGFMLFQGSGHVIILGIILTLHGGITWEDFLCGETIYFLYFSAVWPLNPTNFLLFPAGLSEMLLIIVYITYLMCGIALLIGVVRRKQVINSGII